MDDNTENNAIQRAVVKGDINAIECLKIGFAK